jgi:hypothetical protein
MHVCAAMSLPLYSELPALSIFRTNKLYALVHIIWYDLQEKSMLREKPKAVRCRVLIHYMCLMKCVYLWAFNADVLINFFNLPNTFLKIKFSHLHRTPNHGWNIWGSQSITDVKLGLLACNTMWTCRQISTFQRNILPQSATLKMKAVCSSKMLVPIYKSLKSLKAGRATPTDGTVVKLHTC